VIAAGLFTGGALFAAVVEYPARIEAGVAARPGEARELLHRWARLHEVRCVFGVAGFVTLAVAALG